MIGDNNPEQYCEVSNEGMQGFSSFEKINAEKGYFKKLDATRKKFGGGS
ncbi:MAG: hypothetical protein IKM47_03465 [Bacteroidaceae bacterium]|nr:hypothetical protein [Bacteroidaceae bacterium]